MRQRVLPGCWQGTRQGLSLRTGCFPAKTGQPGRARDDLLRGAVITHHATTDPQSIVRACRPADPGDFDVGAAKPAPTVGLDPSKSRRKDEDLPGFEPDFLPRESGQVVELALCCGFNQPTGEDLPSLYLFSVLAGYSPVIECFH